MMDNMPENLEHISQEQTPEDKEKYTPRPMGHLILAWALIAVVLFGFLGMCYWMINFGKV